MFSDVSLVKAAYNMFVEKWNSVLTNCGSKVIEYIVPICKTIGACKIIKGKEPGEKYQIRNNIM